MSLDATNPRLRSIIAKEPGLLRWQFDDGEPVLLDGLDCFLELFQVHGFRDVAVRVLSVAAVDVFFGIGCGEDDHGNPLRR